MSEDPKADLYLEDEHIFRWVFHRGAKIRLANAEAGYEIADGILKGRRLPVLVEMNARTIDKPSRDYYQEHATRYFTCGVIVVTNAVARILGSFFMGLNAPPMPMAMVATLDDAYSWIGRVVEGASPDNGVRH